MSQLLSLYQAAGPAKFTTQLCAMAPYFGSIAPSFNELAPSRASVDVPFRREITNHLGTVHAIALCNAAELVAGTMTDVSIPAGWQWIPKGMQVRYLAKVKSDFKAVADGSQVDWTTEGDLDVPVSITDQEGKQVFTAVVTMVVRRGKASA
ncbi:MAG: hotdog fold domain-containing protein [Stagnimonas sp.]|nr:hotdog fold domain-containing protein [Stagnimonas sp.]